MAEARPLSYGSGHGKLDGGRVGLEKVEDGRNTRGKLGGAFANSGELLDVPATPVAWRRSQRRSSTQTATATRLREAAAAGADQCRCEVHQGGRGLAPDARKRWMVDYGGRSQKGSGGGTARLSSASGRSSSRRHPTSPARVTNVCGRWIGIQWRGDTSAAHGLRTRGEARLRCGARLRVSYG